MATKPTRGQERACDLAAEALLKLAEAARLDGWAPFGLPEIREIGRAAAQVASAFDLGEIVGRALEARGKALGLRAGASELLVLFRDPPEPIVYLFVDNDTFRADVAKAEAELGDD